MAQERELRQYRFRGRHSSGRVMEGVIEAATLAEARERIRAAGWTEVDMLEDDMASAVTRLFGRTPDAIDADPGTPVTVEPEPKADPRAMGTLLNFLKAAQELSQLDDDPQAEAPQEEWRSECVEQGWNALVLPLYDLLLDLRGRAQWPRALRLAEAMETIQAELGVGGIPEMDLFFVQASALANGGNLPEALRRVERFATDPAVEPWTYWGRLASVYSHAKDYRGERECKFRAIQHNPECGSSYLDLAVYLVHHDQAVEESKRAMATAIEKGLSVQAEPFLNWARGCQALHENRNQDAATEFSDAITLMEATEVKGLLRGLLDTLRAYRGLALTRCGDLKNSALELNELRDFLLRCREDELLKKWEESLAAGAPSR